MRYYVTCIPTSFCILCIFTNKIGQKSKVRTNLVVFMMSHLNKLAKKVVCYYHRVVEVSLSLSLLLERNGEEEPRENFPRGMTGVG